MCICSPGVYKYNVLVVVNVSICQHKEFKLPINDKQQSKCSKQWHKTRIKVDLQKASSKSTFYSTVSIKVTLCVFSKYVPINVLLPFLTHGGSVVKANPLTVDH